MKLYKPGAYNRNFTVYGIKVGNMMWQTTGSETWPKNENAFGYPQAGLRS